MNQIEFLVRQTEDAYYWTNQLVDSIPYDKWDRIPEVIETSVTWQTGHLIMSFYFHSVMVIAGHQTDMVQKMPLKDYSDFFTIAPPAQAAGKVDARLLHEHLKVMQQKSLDIIGALSPADLEKPLEPTPMPHPIAKTKYEALDWNIKHTMWHCGQLGLLKRIVDRRHDFGLKVPGGEGR